MADSTVAPSGGDFSTLAAALSDAGTGAGDTITISGDWTSTTDTTAATVADNNITIITSGSARHAGFDNAGSNYELAVTSGHCITVDNLGCTIDGLLLHVNHAGSSDETIRNEASTLTVVNTICRGNEGGTSNQDGIYTQVASTINLENCYFTQFGRGGVHNQQATGVTITVNAISVGMYECGLDASGDAGGFLHNSGQSGSVSNFNVHNSWVADCDAGSAECFRDDGVGADNWQLDNCFATDASISGNDGGAVNATENATITVTPGAGTLIVVNSLTAPYDFRLQDDADNDVQDQHTNATGAGLTIGDYTTGDIAGTSRPQNTSHDIGPFEIVAGGGETITADAGSYAWTGTAASLEHHKLISAAAGSYAWTGTAATLLKSTLLSAEAGSYAWTGQTASLEHHQVISAVGGSYAWTGQDATLTHLTGETLTAEAGSYAWTGQTVNLLLDRVLSAEAGSYAWTGTAATLTVVPVVTSIWTATTPASTSWSEESVASSTWTPTSKPSTDWTET